MKVEIITYRGFEIEFDTDKGTFSAWSDFYDDEFSKKSFPAIKKGVDDYLKNNAEFRPFKVQEMLGYNGKVEKLGRVLTITGIRKDGKLVYLDANGNKKFIKKVSESHYAIHTPNNDPLKAELDALKEDFDAYRAKYRADKEALLKLVELIPLNEKKIELLKNHQ